MYFELAHLSGENVLTVLYCAKKYMIAGLELLCREYLEKNIDHDNVCFILEQVREVTQLSKLTLYCSNDKAKTKMKE